MEIREPLGISRKQGGPLLASFHEPTISIRPIPLISHDLTLLASASLAAGSSPSAIVAKKPVL